MMDIRDQANWREDAARKIALEDYKLESAEALERLKYQVEFSQAALRNLQLVNGGAMIALLTFIGNVQSGLDARSAAWSFGWFACGLAAGLSAYLGAYFSQAYFMNVAYSKAWEAQYRAKGSLNEFPHVEDMRKGNLALRIAIALAVLSFVSFVVGCFVAIEGLR